MERHAVREQEATLSNVHLNIGWSETNRRRNPAIVGNVVNGFAQIQHRHVPVREWFHVAVQFELMDPTNPDSFWEYWQSVNRASHVSMPPVDPSEAGVPQRAWKMGLKFNGEDVIHPSLGAPPDVSVEPLIVGGVIRDRMPDPLMVSPATPITESVQFVMTDHMGADSDADGNSHEAPITKRHAPISGRIGAVRVSQGARYARGAFEPDHLFHHDDRTVALWRFGEGNDADSFQDAIDPTNTLNRVDIPPDDEIR